MKVRVLLTALALLALYSISSARVIELYSDSSNPVDSEVADRSPIFALWTAKGECSDAMETKLKNTSTGEVYFSHSELAEASWGTEEFGVPSSCTSVSTRLELLDLGQGNWASTTYKGN